MSCGVVGLGLTCSSAPMPVADGNQTVGLKDKGEGVGFPYH